MLERIDDLPAREFDLAGYAADARPRFADIEDVFWKLERGQTFRELDDPGYDAFARGDWTQALKIEHEAREAVRRHYAKVAESGYEPRRLRIVESPVSPYLQWEMHALRIRAEEGERIRVLAAGAVADRERTGPLPEVIILGTKALYRVLYDESGAACGARRVLDTDVIEHCRVDMDDLWALGEDLMAYFAREIAPLPPPPARP
ncbi:DUF6879 family protein [Actinomadura adrarensis]|uniref:DUF6879 family protein n=1 Tax=Actinomadura adrarensis TaxID=1819600 RepID=A0ABW3CB90_9ACTN